MPVTFFLMSFCVLMPMTSPRELSSGPAAVTRIDGRVGLNPGAGAGGGKLADGTDNSFGDAEEHGIAWITDGDDIFTLVDGGGVGES